MGSLPLAPPRKPKRRWDTNKTIIIPEFQKIQRIICFVYHPFKFLPCVYSISSVSIRKSKFKRFTAFSQCFGYCYLLISLPFFLSSFLVQMLPGTLEGFRHVQSSEQNKGLAPTYFPFPWKETDDKVLVNRYWPPWVDGSGVKNLPAMQEPQQMWFNRWVQKILWRR